MPSRSPPPSSPSWPATSPGSSPPTLRTAVLCLAEPFGGHTWTRLSVHVQNVRRQADTPDQVLRVAVGQPFVVHATVDGIVPASAKLEVDGPAHTDKIIPIKRDPDSPTGTFTAAIDMTQQRGTFRFRLLANDGSYPPRSGSWQEVEVLPPPKLIELDGHPSPQIELQLSGVHRLAVAAATCCRARAARGAGRHQRSCCAPLRIGRWTRRGWSCSRPSR